MLGPAPRSVPDPNVDIGIPEVVKPCLRAISQFLNDLDAPDMFRKLRQNGGLVSKSSADLENYVARLRFQEIRH